jgi:hypothetical protein
MDGNTGCDERASKNHKFSMQKDLCPQNRISDLELLLGDGAVAETVVDSTP